MFLVVYARIYGKALVDALGVIGRNPWTLLLPSALFLVWTLVMSLFALLFGGDPVSGFIGGFIVASIRAGLLSVYSYFLAQMVGRQTLRLTVDELRSSIGAYFFNWISFFFLIFLVSLGFEIATKNNPEGQTLVMILFILGQILLNTVPETIYLKGTGSGMDTVQRAFSFFQESWIEWLVPNSLLIAASTLFFLFGSALFTLIPFGGVLIPLFGGALLHLFAVFRGFLYELLDGSTHRQRMFKYRGSA